MYLETVGRDVCHKQNDIGQFVLMKDRYMCVCVFNQYMGASESVV